VARASGGNYVPHYRRILLAVDLAPESVLVGHRAQEIATALGAELGIVHALEPLPLVAPIPPEPVGASLLAGQAELMEIAREQIGALARELRVPEERTQVVLGPIKSQIIRAAVYQKADLLVLGSHERHGLAFLIAPIEDAVIHRAPCDVLAVRIPDH
jgi:universal stress protein A